MASTQPVFRVHIGKGEMGFLLAFAVVLGAEAAYAGVVNHTLQGFNLVGVGILLCFFLRLWSFDLRNALFGDDRASVTGKGFHESFSYASIDEVAKVRVIPLFTLPTQVHIHVGGRQEPFVIPWNPRNKQLNMDLFTWLTQKTESAQRNR